LNIKLENVLPMEIEKRSFELIEAEMTTNPPEDIKPIMKRVIHTTADFEYEHTLTFSQNVIEIAKEAIRNGACVVTDTNMVRAGINKKKLAEYGGEVFCFMADDDVCEDAKKSGSTRASASMEKATKLNQKLIFAIGNAPTALVKIRELIDEGKLKPELIIGVPVGFVNVVASKELILETDIPYIIAKGRKGGSNVAAAIVNALLYSL
jgi:precorrin-8X/cobalt-precorrin-8 methylmutase